MKKRNLYLNNTPLETALDKYLAALKLKEPKKETVQAVDSLGRVTASAVFARFNSPLYDSAAMDGIAVVSAHTDGARESSPVHLMPKRDFTVIDTGDPVMPPFDAVIMAEELEENSDGTVSIRAAAAPWQHLRPVGEDIVQGELVLASKHTVRAIDIGMLLSSGITELDVIKQPVVAVIPTGSELVEPNTVPKKGDIIESNSRMLAALVEEGGGVPNRHSIVKDEYASIKKAVANAVQHSDMVIINAGSSAGTEDYTAAVLSEIGEVVVHGVAIKPGKPVILAVVSGKPVIGLPGYPVSAYIAYLNFVQPILSRLACKEAQQCGTVQAIVSRTLVSSLKHREYVRVKLGSVDGRLVASPLARGAGAAMSLVRSDGFCIIDQNSEGVRAGDTVNIQLTKLLTALENTLVSVGSHDLILDIIADIMPSHCAGFNLSSTHVGSMGGLLALKRGETHIAPIHLLDEGSGVYNIPVVKSMFSGDAMAIIKGVGRTQGIMVQRGNPLGVSGAKDLLRCRYINRQRGAGTRMLLDYILMNEKIDSSQINGYEREAATHMAVAAAISSGSADAGFGILSAAEAMGLDFVPIGTEEYDFALPQKYLQLPTVKAFVAVLKSPQFKQKLSELGGYSSENLGTVITL